MPNEQFWTQVVIACASIITTYITVKHGPKLTNYLKNTPKESAADTKFNLWTDGYARLIKELQTELSQARTINDKQAIIMEKMQDKINVLDDKLHEAQIENRRLNRKLSAYGENGVV